MSEYFLGKSSKSDEECQCCNSLTYKERLLGFTICSIIGWILSVLSIISLLSGKRSVDQFAILYSCGNLICILSTCFLSGPKKQAKSMTESKRLITTIVFFISVIGTIIFSVVYQITPLLIVFVVLQFCAYFWYTLSYVPFGQSLFKKCCMGLCP